MYSHIGIYIPYMIFGKMAGGQPVVEGLEQWTLNDWMLSFGLTVTCFAFIILGLSVKLKKLTNQLAEELEKKTDTEHIFMNDFAFIWQLVVETGELTASAGASRLAGYDFKKASSAQYFWTEQVYYEDSIAAQEMFDQLLSGEEIYQELRFVTPENDVVWLGVYGNPIIEDGKVKKLVGIALDINEQKRLNEEMHQLAYFDQLTHLPNHQQLEKKLNELEARANNKQFAFYSLDVDRFKIINETRGRDVGDQILVSIAERLTEYLDDSIVISRESGDDFCFFKN
jgi:PAS domain S-box-containing protein